MKLEALQVGALIMRTDRESNFEHAAEMWLVTKIDRAKAKFEAVCLHSVRAKRMGETGFVLFEDLPEYDLIAVFRIQSQSISPFLRYGTAEPKKDLYLRWAFGKKTTLGKIGDQTPFILENGRPLMVGDVVTVTNGYMQRKGCLVVWDAESGYYIMGFAGNCNSKKGKIALLKVSIERGYYCNKAGDAFVICQDDYPAEPDIEVVDFDPRLIAEVKE